MSEGQVRRVLISVWDKSGLVDLARSLVDLGTELVASGGTAKTLSEAGIEATSVEDVTKAPEFLGGRVKTLHPAIHGAILARRDHEQDLAELAERGIEPIDLVVVTLYPFWEAEDLGADDEAGRTELIDIGGVTLIRAAAKNWRHVAVVTDTGDYAAIVDELSESGGRLSAATRKRLAAKALRLTAWYDSQIAGWMSEGEEGWPERWTIGAELTAELRYGENPHQSAALYADRMPRPDDLTAIDIIQGKALSYNNDMDVEAARRVVRDLHELDPNRIHCAIIKHTIPCGTASAETALEAYTRALAADPVSAFGGIVALTAGVDRALAERLSEHFLEVIYAPRFDDAAKEALGAKKNLRLLTGPLPSLDGAGYELRRVAGGILVQGANREWLPEGNPREALQVPTEASPSAEQWDDLLFAWTVCRSVASNAIVLASGLATVGVGGGQTNRVGAVELAVKYARELGHEPEGAVLASDGFFPFADNIERAAEAGIAAIIQPGGSRRDDEVIAAADAAGIPMVLTGMRQFRH